MRRRLNRVRCRARITRSTGVAATYRPPARTASPEEPQEVYPHHRTVRRLDVAPRWTTWLTRTADGRSHAVRLVSLPADFDLSLDQRFQHLTAGLPHSVPVEHLQRRGDSLAVLFPAPAETLRERFVGRPAAL